VKKPINILKTASEGSYTITEWESEGDTRGAANNTKSRQALQVGMKAGK